MKDNLVGGSALKFEDVEEGSTGFVCDGDTAKVKYYFQIRNGQQVEISFKEYAELRESSKWIQHGS